jgi:multiple antibiotic resistance protein
LIGSYLIGTHILAFFGISVPVVQVGGGLIVISTGWAMLKQGEEEQRSKAHREVQLGETFPQAFYPLTLPLTVGPGSISVAIILGANARHGEGVHLTAILAALVGSLLIAFSIHLCYGFADRLARIVGKTGMTVITRLSSFLLVCIGVQILWNGVRVLVGTLPGHGG